MKAEDKAQFESLNHAQDWVQGAIGSLRAARASTNNGIDKQVLSDIIHSTCELEQRINSQIAALNK